MKYKLLYLSRGRGFGHAMRDLLILKNLKKENVDFQIKLVSYAQGYTYLKNNGCEVQNLNLRLEEEHGLKASFRLESLILQLKPDLIVSDEVFNVFPISKKFNIPSILITNWFCESISKDHPLIPAVKKADHIIFADKKEFHEIPPDLSVPISFVGPIIKEFNYILKDKEKAREKLGLDNKDIVILVTPGSTSEDGRELLELSAKVFKKINRNNLKMIFLTGELYKEYLEKFKDEDKIIIKPFEREMDRLMVASDLVICKGTLSTTWELIFLGIPSISIAHLDNPVDIIRIGKLSKRHVTIEIKPQELSATTLLEKVNKILNSERERENMRKRCIELADQRGQKEATRIITNFTNKKIFIKSTKKKYDIIFLSYDEPAAEEHWKRLKSRFPKAKRVHGIKGILKAHKECAKIAKTDNFFVVDGDQYILDDFNFYDVEVENADRIFYMWSSKNAVNDLIYPNGGIKLFPKTIFDGIEDYGIDLFVQLPHKIASEKVPSLNRFNVSPFYSWRAGFRECVHLASKDEKSMHKNIKIHLLNVWCNKGADRPFGKWCIEGARLGREYGERNKDNKEKLELFNDFDWLKEKFDYELKNGSLKDMN